MQVISIHKDTWLKQTNEKYAKDLSDGNKVFIAKGTEIEVTKIFPTHDKQNHIKVWLAKPLKDKTTWYGYKGDINFPDTDLDEEEKTPDKDPDASSQIFVPNKRIDWTNFSTKVSQFLTLGEVYQFDKRRIATSPNVRKRILFIAKQFDLIRAEWGSAIGVTSGYRPPHINASIGGASRSRHIQGDALDIYPHNRQFKKFEKFVDANWYGALGYGVSSGRGFTHIDCRNDKGWKTGGSKGGRWRY